MTTRVLSEEMRGKLTLRVLQTKDGFLGVLIGAPGGQPTMIRSDDLLDVRRRLEQEAGRHHPNYFGFDGARARFLREFPGGFADPGYFAAERKDKLEGKNRLAAMAPLATAMNGTGLGPTIWGVLKDKNLNLPSWREKAKLKVVLCGPSGDPFVQAAAAFTMGARGPALAEMERFLRPQGIANWSIVTFLPFLWGPDRHVFLKPTPVCDFAMRVGHPFPRIYAAQLDMAVYDALLDLAACTETEIADLRPQDRIDVQSFIWVVGQPEPSAAVAG